MRKYLIILALLSFLPLATRGQTTSDIDLSGLPKATQAKSLRYWFDDDDGKMYAVNTTSGNYSLDISSLVEGLHTVHFQIVDNEENAAYVSSAVFLKTGNVAGGESLKATKLRYWFDDERTIHQSEMTGEVQMIDASMLSDGLHTIHYQALCNNGSLTSPKSSVFLSIDTETAAVKSLRYWFDDERTIHQSEMTGEVQMIDASMLSDGLHTIHYQALCNNGSLTSPKSSVFLRLSADMETSAVKSLRYWFDDGQNVTETNYASGVQTFNVSTLSEGLHTIHCQTIDDRGGLGVPYSSIFLKMDCGNTSGTAQSIRYWFDDEDLVVKTTDIANGTQVLDVSELKTGVHTLCYQLVDSNGNVSTPKTGLFMKFFDKVIADGQNRIIEYQYWVNRNSQAMKTVKVSDAVNPYTLISLLPMQKEPIHSDFFHFEITNGQPMIYAKNVFHIRFCDAAGYSVDGDKPFVDYNVKQEVTDVEILKSGVRATTTKPMENVIKWYQLDAESGDSLQFKLDRAATIQLFAPSGKEVHSVSGAESVKWNGLHAKETGTFYLALHDVTATQGTTINIDYNHIDKYAVLRQDVDVVGNGGCSTITFEGNGFRDLYAVDLYNEQGDSIHHVYIGHESDATTSVVFDFTDAVLGIYSAVFHFTGEDKIFSKLITVEEARDIELATTVTYPSRFLRGTSTTYTIKITNKGNMTAYNVPLRTYIGSKTKSGVSSINIEGLDLESPFDRILIDSVPISDRAEVERIFKSLDDSHYFINIHTTDANNDSIVVRSAYFFVTMQPNSTKCIKLSITANETVDVWITTEPDWFALEVSNMDSMKSNRRLKARRSSKKDGYCCVKDAIECGISLAVTAADIASVVTTAIALAQGGTNLGADAVAYATAVADCVAGVVSNMYSSINTMVCEGENPLDNLKNNFNPKISVLNMVLSCLGTLKSSSKVAQALLGVASMGTGVDVVANDVVLIADCITKSSKKKPNCPPNPSGGGGTSISVKSFDPNDIYGYTAESGSKALKDGLTDIYYTIQFENDTVFATAPAHDIYLTDTLDVNLFDLSTYRPTTIKIGEKSMNLTGERNFISTLDMRPEINAIAQIEGMIDDETGVVRWHISSLDPMTMEPVQDAMVGVLPVNFDGSGMGEASFDISLKNDLPHGTEISNRSGNIFDSNETILTPAWTNVIDRISPTSRVTDVQQLSDTMATVSIKATDELSGPWRYDVYVQYGRGSAWWKAAENVPVDTTATVKIYDGIDHGFYVVVTDSAGNVERKQAMREMTLNLSTTVTGDVNGDSQVGIADIVAVTSYMAGNSSNISLIAADVNGDGQVGIADIVALTDIMAGTANVKGRQSVRNKTYFIRRKTKEQ